MYIVADAHCLMSLRKMFCYTAGGTRCDKAPHSCSLENFPGFSISMLTTQVIFKIILLNLPEMILTR